MAKEYSNNRFCHLKKGDKLYALIEKRIDDNEYVNIYLLKEIEIISEPEIDDGRFMTFDISINYGNCKEKRAIGFQLSFWNPEAEYVNYNSEDCEDDVIKISDDIKILYPVFEEHNKKMKEIFEKGLSLLNQIEDGNK